MLKENILAQRCPSLAFPSASLSVPNQVLLVLPWTPAPAFLPWLYPPLSLAWEQPLAPATSSNPSSPRLPKVLFPKGKAIKSLPRGLNTPTGPVPSGERGIPWPGYRTQHRSLGTGLHLHSTAYRFPHVLPSQHLDYAAGPSTQLPCLFLPHYLTWVTLLSV